MSTSGASEPPPAPDAELERELLEDVRIHAHPSDDDGGDSGKTLTDALSALAGFYVERDRWADALPVLRRAVKVSRQYRPTWEVALRVDLAEALVRCGLVDEARKAVARLHVSRSALDESMARRLSEVALRLGQALEPAPAAQPARERYRHPKLGVGTLVSRAEGKVTLVFDDGATRTVLESFVTRVVE